MHSPIKAAAAAALVLLAIATAAPAATAATAATAPAASGLEAMGSGDMLHITVFRNPELTTDARVNERGTIAFPMVGDVDVNGLTPAQAAQRIADKLKQGGFVVNPEVSISVAQVNSRQVSVLGNVNKPGRYPLDATTAHLTDLLAVAGGISASGSDNVTLVTSRDGKPTSIEIDVPTMLASGDLSQNVTLSPGDTVFVHRAPMVYVYGEVQKAGAYRVEKDMTVMQAIAMGGGLTVRGTERGIRLTRKEGAGGTRQMNVKLTDRVQTDDVIYVRESLF